MSNTEIEDVDGIAIVGMAGRFPGARTSMSSGEICAMAWRRSPHSLRRSYVPQALTLRCSMIPVTCGQMRQLKIRSCLMLPSLASTIEKLRSWIRSTASSWSARGKHWRMPGTMRIPTRDASAFTPDTGCPPTCYRTSIPTAGVFGLSVAPRPLSQRQGPPIPRVSYKLNLKGPSLTCRLHAHFFSCGPCRVPEPS